MRSLPVVLAITAVGLVGTAAADDESSESTSESTSTSGDASAAPEAASTPDADPDPIALLSRSLVKSKGAVVLSPSLLIARYPYTIASGTSNLYSEAARLILAAGLTDKLTAGVAYSMVLNDGIDGTSFSPRGLLTVFGSDLVLHKGALAIAAGADFDLNFAGPKDSSGNPQTQGSVRAGATVRFTILDKVALYTGSPLAGTPQGHQLSIELFSKGRSSLAFPIGLAVQVIPKVYAYTETTLAEIFFVNGPKDSGGNETHFRTIGDITPLAFGGYYSLKSSIDLGAALSWGNLDYTEYFLITVGARLHTGP